MVNFALQTRKTSPNHDFFIKNQAKPLIFHGFPCQNFPTVNPSSRHAYRGLAAQPGAAAGGGPAQAGRCFFGLVSGCTLFGSKILQKCVKILQKCVSQRCHEMTGSTSKASSFFHQVSSLKSELRNYRQTTGKTKSKYFKEQFVFFTDLKNIQNS